MNFFSQVRLGVSTYAAAYRLIITNRLWAYVIAPGIINIFIFIISFILVSAFSQELVSWALSSISSLFSFPEWLSGINPHCT